MTAENLAGEILGLETYKGRSKRLEYAIPHGRAAHVGGGVYGLDVVGVNVAILP
jgi:hypothetical protein